MDQIEEHRAEEDRRDAGEIVAALVDLHTGPGLHATDEELGEDLRRRLEAMATLKVQRRKHGGAAPV